MLMLTVSGSCVLYPSKRKFCGNFISSSSSQDAAISQSIIAAKKALVEERGEGRLRRSMAVIGRENRMRLRFRAWSPSCKILGDLPSKQPSQLKLRFRRGKENEHLSLSIVIHPERRCSNIADNAAILGSRSEPSHWTIIAFLILTHRQN